MFTGIVKELGIVKRMSRAGSIYKLAIGSGAVYKTVKTGDSIAVNGACLTVVSSRGGVISFDVMEETARRTNLAELKSEDHVNLEDSLKAGDPLSGHFVLGHIDCLGKIKDIERSGAEFLMEIDIPPDFADLIVEKGSVAIDGVSLTIGEAGKDKFTVYLIPHTVKTTTLGSRCAGDKINIEFDILGKYILRRKLPERTSKISENFLKERGF